MKWTVKEVAKQCRISVRTLHYYDQIHLLSPAETTEAGYRLYGETELARLQQILFFRELDFPLKEIKMILDSPNFDANIALQRHRSLLTLKRDRLVHLISLVDQILKGDLEMDFKAFDTGEIEAMKEKYAQEAKERWGNTTAYQEQQTKAAAYSKDDWEQINAQMKALFEKLSDCMNYTPNHPTVQALIAEYQKFITEHFYRCTPEIFAGLGEMYLTDERFTKNIDQYGEGLSQFLHDAIKIYCKNDR